jgi:hypothetical protein
VCSRTSGSAPSRLSCAQASAVRRSCQTIARWIGRPVLRSQRTGRLTLVRDADGRDARGSDAGLLDGLARRQEDVAPDVLGVVLDPARPPGSAEGARAARARRCWPSLSKTTQRVDVVPWSMASRCRGRFICLCCRRLAQRRDDP